ncbi:MAG: universal stress protein [Ginsengibacter sp.]
MKTILVPTDFSNASLNATNYAISLAKVFDSEIVLINIIPPAAIAHDSMFASIMITQAEILQQQQDLMQNEIEKLSKQHDGKIKAVVKDGYLSDIIPAVAEEEKANLIVMGMKGKGKSNSIFGSTTTEIIRKFTFPVLVIPEATTYSPITQITYATDFDMALEMDRFTVLIALAEKFSAPVKIVHVEKNDNFNLENSIGKIKTNLRFSGIPHEFHTINNKNVLEGINEFIQENPCSILAMVAHNHSLFERMFGKVHTKEMSYQTKLPLLILQGK